MVARKRLGREGRNEDNLKVGRPAVELELEEKRSAVGEIVQRSLLQSSRESLKPLRCSLDVLNALSVARGSIRGPK